MHDTLGIEDRLAIADLFARYAQALDDGDVDGVVSCFAADAVMASPTVGSLHGHAGIRAFAERFARLRDNGSQTRHCISNVRASVADGRVQATAYLLCGLTRDGRSELLPPGRYHCDLVHEKDGWVFTRRVVVHDAQFTIAGI